MQNRFAISCVAAFALYVLATVVTVVTPLAFSSGGRWLAPPCDFSLRMTEIECLRGGVNPFDVWNGDVVLPPYLPNYQSKVSGPEFTKQINAYAPWEYTFMMPLSFLPEKAAWLVYFLLMIASLAIAFGVAAAYAKSQGISVGDRMAVAALAVLFVGYPAWSNIAIGNFSVIVLAALALMAYCLDRDCNVAAGICWAIAMLKPQLGVIFAIPLIMRRKWLVCFVAAGICFAATMLPAAMCKTSPFELILQTPKANLFCFHGAGTLPYALCGLLPGDLDVLVAVSIGALVCWLMTRTIPCGKSWLVYLMPAAVCATCWTYVSTYGHVLGYFLFLDIFVELCKNPRDRVLWVFAALAAMFASCAYLAYHGLVSAFGDMMPALRYSDELHWHLDSFNSAAVLFLTLTYCAFRFRKGANT